MCLPLQDLFKSDSTYSSELRREKATFPNSEDRISLPFPSDYFLSAITMRLLNRIVKYKLSLLTNRHIVIEKSMIIHDFMILPF